MRLSMRTCQDQTSCNKYFARVAEMFEGLEHARGIKVGAHEQRASC